MAEHETVKLPRRGFFATLVDWSIKSILLVTAGGAFLILLRFLFPPKKLMQRLTGWVPTVDKNSLEIGEAAQVIFNGTPFFIIKSGDDKYISFSAVCSHAACIVRWVKNDLSFACPCHESKFDIKGKPFGGPATEPLTEIALKTDETGKIFIKLV